MLFTNHRRVALIGAAIMFAGCGESNALTESGSSPRGLTPAARFDEKTLKDKGDVQIVSASGDITAAVQEYRDLLGGGPPNPNLPGEQPGGRREINWDAVP